MKKRFKEILSRFMRFINLQKKLNKEMKISTLFKVTFLSFSISLLFTLTPLLLITNLLILYNLRDLLVLLMLILIFIGIQIYFHYYRIFLSRFQIDLTKYNLKFIIGYEKKIVSLIFIFFAIIVLAVFI